MLLDIITGTGKSKLDPQGANKELRSPEEGIFHC